MDSLSGIAVFVQVAETRSFTQAARVLGVSASAIGKSIARMEARLGVRLFHRSTRSIALTPEGALFRERCRRILCEAEAAEHELRHHTGTPSGKLRVSMPLICGLVMPILTDFLRAYPDIELELDLTDRLVDVIDEGFDVVVRGGALRDSRLMSRSLGSFGYVLVGSPEYFARHGTPHTPAALAGHACLLHRYAETGKIARWPLRDADVPPMRETLISTTAESLLHTARAGLGIACLPEFLTRDALARGELVPVLDSHVDRPGSFHLLWPASRHASRKLRVFIDYMVEHLVAGGKANPPAPKPTRRAKAKAPPRGQQTAGAAWEPIPSEAT